MSNDFLARDNIWELYGFKQNPFDTAPLFVIGGTLPIESFVGRKEQVDRLSKIFSSKGGSRTLVYGEVGVGKTSFVNVVRHYAFKRNFFTSFKEIAVQSEWDTDAFILNTLAAVYATLKIQKDRPVSNGMFEKLESLFEMGKANYNVGASIMGFGGSYSKERSVPTNVSTYTLHTFFQEIATEIMAKTGKDIIIHYNNLELLPENRMRFIFENLRDFFQTPGIHFVFVGNLTVYSYFQSMPRLSSILTDTPIHIETLTLEEIEKIIHKRFDYLKLSGMRHVVPYTRDCLTALFSLWGGNIRHILNSLQAAVLELTTERPIIFDARLLATTLKSVIEKRYFQNMPKRAKDVLIEVLNHEEITNKSLADKLKIARSNISSYLKDLQEQGCVYVRRKNGKDKFWSAEPKLKWILLEKQIKSQKTLGSFSLSD